MKKVYPLLVLLSLTRIAYTQLPTTNLKVWYDADVNVNVNGSGNVTGWLDNSGNNNDAASLLAGATLETVTGHDGNDYSFVRFAGNSFLSSAYGGSGNATVFIVFNNATNPSQAVNFRNINDSVVYPFGNYRDINGVQVSTDPLPADKSVGNGVTGKDFEIVAFRYERNKANSGVSTWRNGMMLSGRTSADVDLPSLPLYIGGYQNGTQSALATADIAQIVIYGDALDETDMAAAFTYLSDRYNVPENQYAFTSIVSGDWSNTSTWAGGVVPGADDDVIVAPTGPFDWLFITSNTAACKSLTVLENSGVQLIAPASTAKLVIGAGHGFNNEFALKGSFLIDSSELDINGNWLIASNWSDTLTEGLQLENSARIVIDGNNGNPFQSVSAEKPLLDDQYVGNGFGNSSTRLNSVVFGKADIIITDPHLNAQGVAVKNLTGSYFINSPNAGYYGSLQLGDGVSTQPSNNTGGFVVSGNCFFPMKILVNSLSANNRQVSNDGGFNTYHSGIRVNAGGVFNAMNSSLLIGGDLDNDGSFIATDNTLNFAVSHEQSDSLSIKGTGIFNLSNPSVPANITFTGSYDTTLQSRIGIYVPLVVDAGQFYAPNIKVYLHDQPFTMHYWNKSLTESDPVYRPYASYFVFKGTGKLIHDASLSPDSLRFYVGLDSAFTPLTVVNTGTADAFSVSVKPGVTAGANKPNLVNFEWQINEGIPGASNAHLIFEWPKSKELFSPDSATVQARHFNSGTTSWDNLSTLTNQTSIYSNYRQVIATGVSSFSPFSMGASVVVLPVRLLTFEAHRAEQTTILDWQTAQEENSDRFEIERSTPNHPFTAIGIIAAAGNTSSLTNYSFTDQHPSDGINYYRLKQIDIDGKFIYSKTIAVNFGDPGKVLISPNPATDHLDIRLPKGSRYTMIRIVDAAGKPVWQQSVTGTTMKADISRLSKGWYVLQLSGDQSQQQVFLKQ